MAVMIVPFVFSNQVGFLSKIYKLGSGKYFYMLKLLLPIPLYIGLPLFMIFIVLLGGLIYIGSHRLLKRYIQKQHERVGRVLFRTSASLLGLILSFTFANQRVDYFRLKQSLVSEASQIVDIHMGLNLYNSPEAKRIQEEVRDYVLFITEDGWKSINKDPFLSRTFSQFFKIYVNIHKLKPENSLQEELRSSLVADIDQVSDYLQVRMYSTRPEQFNLIYTSVFGLFVIMVLFSVYPPNGLNIMFLSLYNAFIGLLLYFILMMNNPLTGPLQLKAEPFFLLKETIESNLKK